MTHTPWRTRRAGAGHVHRQAGRSRPAQPWPPRRSRPRRSSLPSAVHPAASASARIAPQPQHGSTSVPLAVPAAPGWPARSTIAAATVIGSAAGRAWSRPLCRWPSEPASRRPAAYCPSWNSTIKMSSCAGSANRHRGLSRATRSAMARRRSVRRNLVSPKIRATTRKVIDAGERPDLGCPDGQRALDVVGLPCPARHRDSARAASATRAADLGNDVLGQPRPEHECPASPVGLEEDDVRGSIEARSRDMDALHRAELVPQHPAEAGCARNE